MFSLTNGKPIAKTDESRPDVLCIDDPEQSQSYNSDMSEDYDHEWEESNDNEKMTTWESRAKLIPMPDFTNRFIEYIAGPSGSGKSTIAADLATQFRKIYPRHKIYIMSRTDATNDPAYARLKPIQIPIDESLIEDPIDLAKEITEEGCLIIFDDCNTIHNDKIKKEVEKIMADGMEIGRKLNCNMIITSHLVIPNEKKFARTVMNELQMLTVFPRSGASQQIRYALKQHFGLDNNQIEAILHLKSRWVRISKSYPQYVMYDHGAYIL